jgi:hypothetical protein
MLAFAAGGLPALAVLQANAGRLAARPTAGPLIRRVVPLVAAAVVLWRALAAPAGAPPACHHAATDVAPPAVAQTLDENRRGASADGRLR